MLSQKEVEVHRKLFHETDKTMAEVFKVLSDVNRYRIFRILAEEPKLSVGSIAAILNISLPLASQHIKMLARANLLQKERNGKTIIQKLQKDNPFVLAMLKMIKQALKLTNE
jgi:DNA-binding transcriptional ArsR family regulator